MHALTQRTLPYRQPWLQRHPILAYFTLASVITWAVQLPLVAAAQGWSDRPVPCAIHYLAAYGPLLAALLVTWRTAGRRGLHDLLRRATRWRVGPFWWFAALSPLLPVALPLVVVLLVEGRWLDLQGLGRVNYLPDLGLGALLLWLVTFGLGEEIGWRGFALSRLQRDHTALGASMLVAAGWVVWQSHRSSTSPATGSWGYWRCPASPWA